MKANYLKPQTDIAETTYTIAILQDSIDRKQYGGTLTPEDGGTVIPTGVISTDGSDSPFGNSQGKGTRANESSLWDD